MVNKRLRYYRTQCNLTQQEIANEIGVKRTLVARWEAGLEEIDDYNYKQLAKLFGVSVRRLKGKADRDKVITFVSCNEKYEFVSFVLYIVSFVVFAIALAVLNVWLKVYSYIYNYYFQDFNNQFIEFTNVVFKTERKYILVFSIILSLSIIIFLTGLALKHIKINKDFYK